MSCLNAITIAKNIYHSLAEIDSKDSIYFKQNLENLVIKIEETDTKIRGNLTKDKNPSFLIYHPALTYYAIEYGLTQIPVEEEGREPSATQLKNIITLAKAKKVKPSSCRKNSQIRFEDGGGKCGEPRKRKLIP